MGECVVPMMMPGVDGGTIVHVDAAIPRMDASDVPFDTGASGGEVRRGCGCAAPGGVRGGWLGLFSLFGVVVLARRRRRTLLVLAVLAAALLVSCTVQTARCSLDSECPLGTHCQAGSCQSECSDDLQCIAMHGAGSRCTSFGQCVAPDATVHPDAGLAHDAAAAPDANALDAAMLTDAGTDGGSDAGHDAATVDAGHDAAMPDTGPMLPTPLNETDLPAEADYCVIQFPTSLSTSAGVASASIYGQIFEAGRTDTTVGGPAPGILAELGYGPVGSDPRTSPAWAFHATTFNIETGSGNNNDEYVGTLTIGATGTYEYAYRFSFDAGASFTYCDTNGAGSNGGLTFEPGMLGAITVL
jgi:MYXO-CTERM domain-containing protein